jgi:hypothetical protein
VDKKQAIKQTIMSKDSANMFHKLSWRLGGLVHASMHEGFMEISKYAKLKDLGHIHSN